MEHTLLLLVLVSVRVHSGPVKLRATPTRRFTERRTHRNQPEGNQDEQAYKKEPMVREPTRALLLAKHRFSPVDV